jgi:hypothetical protein
LATLASRVEVNEDVLFQELQGEAVLLNLKSGTTLAWMRWAHEFGSFSRLTTHFRQSHTSLPRNTMSHRIAVKQTS